jgi:hypothetical protein
MFRRPSIVAALAVAVLWLCQFATVRYNYAGNWTGLFCIAPHMPVPDFLRSERLYIFQGSEGYDGQIFHLIAHDPWMRRGSAAAIGGAKFRYQRIFVPALAWILALGRDEYIHAAYFAVILGFACGGVYWLARLALLRQLAPWWGLAFIAVPATITSIDLMTADVALAAFCVGFVLYAEEARFLPILAVLTSAALTRETAALIVAGYVLYLLSRRQFGQAIAAACTVLPAGLWFLYVSHGAMRSEAVNYVNWVPLYGFVERLLHSVAYALPDWKTHIAILFDYLALLGIALMFLAMIRMAAARRWNPTTSAIYTLALATVFLRSADVWADAYNFGRVLSPLLLLTFLEDLRKRPLAALAPMILIDLRISLNLIGQLEGIVRGLLK